MTVPIPATFALDLWRVSLTFILNFVGCVLKRAIAALPNVKSTTTITAAAALNLAAAVPRLAVK